MSKIAIAAVFLLAGSAWAEPKYTKEQLEARFYYDLGPAEIDVSSYPEKRKQEYSLFKQTCSECHTLARPINSPVVQRSDWKRFVVRMHLKDKIKDGDGFYKWEAKTIIDFLAYDSQIRKVARKAEFEAKAKELRGLFQEVGKERSRLQVQEDGKKVKVSAPGAEVKPQSQSH